MINNEKLKKVIKEYKMDYLSRWADEKYKWEAIKHFQEHWDINASNFSKMFMEATAKTSNLLVSMNNFPKGMIKEFANVDQEATRAMFIKLYDESIDIGERVEEFNSSAEAMRIKYGEGKWKQHYQNLNSISTYLWLRYPDKYYIYKYTVVKAVAKELDADFIPKTGLSVASFVGVFNLYNEISEQLKVDKELVELLKSSLNDNSYSDRELKTLTIDICYYISTLFSNKDIIENSEWFPNGYSPNITTEKWLELLADETVFTKSSLEIMKRLKDYGGMATCSQLAIKYGESKNFYNSGSSALAKRVADYTMCPILSTDTDDIKWWPILYIGKKADKSIEGVFIWKLRDELSRAIDKFDLSKVLLYSEKIQMINEQIKRIEVVESYSKDDFLEEVYMTGERFDTLVSLLKNKQNLILQGAPGVGKTFASKRLAYAMMNEKDDTRIEFIQFHQNYSYEDFIMGYRPQGEGFELQNGIFYNFCLKAANNPYEPFFFIIDEINRGNMSKIFGELLMLIEKDYRGTKATLAYNGMPFSVPENLYIIGMMNTADRSLAMIDYALRRRFSFFEMDPGFNSDGFKAYQESFDNEIFNSLIERVKELNKEISSDSSLGKGFRIGHSYFCGKRECTNEWMKEVVEYDILPMLSEYWFDEEAKLQRWENILRGVLND